MSNKNRTGLFIWEKWERGVPFSNEDFRGIFDSRLTADCRSNGYKGVLLEWAALASVESWGDGILNPDGSIEGDHVDPYEVFVPIEEISQEEYEEYVNGL